MSERHILICNVFFVPNTYGGATVVAEEVAQTLAAQTGWRVSAVSLWCRDDLVPYCVTRSCANGIDSYLVSLPAMRPSVEGYSNPRISEVIGGLMDDLAPDLCHVHCVQDMGAGVIETAKMRDIPVVLSVHDYWWICQRQFMIRPDETYCGQSPVQLKSCRGCLGDMSGARTRQGYLHRQAAMADLITYPSHFALDLCESSGLAPGQGIVWQNGVRQPGHGFFDAQAARRAGDPRLRFGYLGGPARLKGWHDIRAAFAGVDREDFTVTLADGSPDGSWWRGHDFSELPGDWSVAPRFAQSEMDVFYAGIDILLFPSQWKETFGLAIREALARGITVIQTDSGGTVEHRGSRKGLIPIGAGPGPLQERITTLLNSGARGCDPVEVQSFENQAGEFAEFARRLWTPVVNRRLPREARQAQRDSQETAA